MARGYIKGFGAFEVREGPGPVVGLVSKAVADKIAEQRKLYGGKYDKTAAIYQGWPSALTRELELRRALAMDPKSKFRNERDDPEFELNEANMIKTIADSPVEIGVVYDKHNRLISFAKGSPTQVIAEALRSQMEGGTFIHNHPADGPLSNGDIAAHLSYKSGTTKAVSREGIYEISGPSDFEGSHMSLILSGAQSTAVGQAVRYAYSLFRDKLTEAQQVDFKKTRDMRELFRVLPKDVAQKVTAIIHKNAWEQTIREVASCKGTEKLKFKFTPSANFAKLSGYKDYDSVPSTPRGFYDESDDSYDSR